MTRDNLRELYSDRSAIFLGIAGKHTRFIQAVSLARLATGVAMIWLLVMGISRERLLFLILPVLLLLVLFLLVALHQSRRNRRGMAEGMVRLNETELACLEHRFDHLPGGERFSDRNHPWSYDLDIFGSGSLYQYLNRTATHGGGERLATLLTTEPGGVETVTRRQEMIDDLKGRIDFRQTFTARAELLREKEEDRGEIARWIGSGTYMNRHPWLFTVSLASGAAAGGLIAAGIADPACFWYLLPLAGFNFTLLSFFLGRTNRYHSMVSNKHGILEGYAGLLEVMAEESFHNRDLSGRSAMARTGMAAIRKLARRLHLFDQRLNMLLGPLFNGLFLFDFTMVWFLERWKRKNREGIMEWIALTGWMDAMISLSGFAFNHPGFAVPEFGGSEDPLEASMLGHPLIPDRKRVDNDFTISTQKVVIITGANMAGKSTFLRAMGINMVLAYAGCPVCASRFRTGLPGLCTSMRTADSLKDEESYFLAEIRKLQRIVQRMDRGEPLLILLDEVLKGTNTTDKKKGSIGLIGRCLSHRVRCLIATHDLSLGEQEKEHPGLVVNYCFESRIRDLELQFDYKLRPGVATSMNATFLMKQMGITD